MYPIKNVTSEKIARDLLKSLALQLERPAHGDRNKALYNLLALAKSKPSLKEDISKQVGSFTRYLYKNSILSNIKDPAKELLELIK